MQHRTSNFFSLTLLEMLEITHVPPASITRKRTQTQTRHHEQMETRNDTRTSTTKTTFRVLRSKMVEERGEENPKDGLEKCLVHNVQNHTSTPQLHTASTQHSPQTARTCMPTLSEEGREGEKNSQSRSCQQNATPCTKPSCTSHRQEIV